MINTIEFEKEQKEIANYTTNDGRAVLIKQIMRYENKTQINRIEWHYYINGEFDSIQNLDMRMFFPQELDSYLESNGFNIIHKFGGFEEEAFNDNSEKQIFELLSKESELTIDVICRTLDLPVYKLSPLLLQMEFKGLVKFYPGNIYRTT